MTITKHAALLLTTCVALVGLGHAQMDTTIKAQVPFSFVANGTTMPASECTIQSWSTGERRSRSAAARNMPLPFPLQTCRQMRAKKRHWCFTNMATISS
jgi:hypothetical protein